MKYLEKEVAIRGQKAILRGYIPDNNGDSYYKNKRPAVIIFPGGGYRFTYSGEAEPIALKFAGEGICAFVLDYSCAPVRFPVPQLQAFQTIRYVRENAKEWGIDERNIATCGFSAGGHVCSCTGTLWNKFDKYFAQEGMNDVDRLIYRPDKLILCYPVICSPINEYSHKGSFNQLLGEQVSDNELLELLSTDAQVDVQTPPTFIWHTSSDTAVSPINSYTFALALAKVKIPCETHIYLEGEHGLCLGTCVTLKVSFDEAHETAEWISKAVRFMYVDFKKE